MDIYRIRLRILGRGAACVFCCRTYNILFLLFSHLKSYRAVACSCRDLCYGILAYAFHLLKQQHIVQLAGKQRLKVTVHHEHLVLSFCAHVIAVAVLVIVAYAVLKLATVCAFYLYDVSRSVKSELGAFGILSLEHSARRNG